MHPGSTDVVQTNTLANRIFQENNFAKFVNPNDATDYKWVRFVSIANNGLLSTPITQVQDLIKLSQSISEQYSKLEK